MLAAGASTQTNPWIVLAAVATAVFTGVFMIVAWRNYLHDLAVSGSRKPVIAKGVRSTWKLENRHIPLAPEYHDSGRVIPVRFLNRAHTTETISVNRVSFWFGPEGVKTDHPHGTEQITTVSGEAFLVGVSHPDWPNRDRFWATVTFETKNGDRFRRWGYLKLWAIP